MKKRNLEFEKLMEYLEKGDYKIQFSWINKRTFGRVEPCKEAIVINFELHLVETYIHEYLHQEYSYLEEEVVEQKTKRIISRMKKEEILTLADWLGEIYWENREKHSFKKR